MILEAQKNAATKAAKTVTDATVSVTEKAMDLGSTAGQKAGDMGSSAVTSITETATEVFHAGTDLASKGILRVKEFKLGEKNVGERAQATVETVSERIDIDQLQDQVAKLRHQMESVMGTWKDTFRPAATAQKAPAAKAPATKATTRKAPATKAPSTKTTTAAKKAPAKKATATKTTTAAKKAPAKKATATKKPAASK